MGLLILDNLRNLDTGTLRKLFEKNIRKSFRGSEVSLSYMKNVQHQGKDLIEAMFVISKARSSNKILGRMYSGSEGTAQVYGIASELIYPAREKNIVEFLTSLQLESQ